MMTVELKIQQIPPPRPFKYSSVLGVVANKRKRILAVIILQNCTRLHYKDLLAAS